MHIARTQNRCIDKHTQLNCTITLTYYWHVLLTSDASPAKPVDLEVRKYNFLSFFTTSHFCSFDQYQKSQNYLYVARTCHNAHMFVLRTLHATIGTDHSLNFILLQEWTWRTVHFLSFQGSNTHVGKKLCEFKKKKKKNKMLACFVVETCHMLSCLFSKWD